MLVKELGFVQSLHDTQVYELYRNAILVLVLSLHVDDLMPTGEDAEVARLHTELEKRVGKVKWNKSNFRHYGMDVRQQPTTHDVTFDQTSYLNELKPVNVERTRGDGRMLDTPLKSREETDFRSLASGVAWL